MRPEFFEVGFGNVLRYSGNPSMQYIVTATYEDYVNTCRIQVLEDGREAIMFGGGSTMYEEIDEIVNRWDLERVRRGVILGCQVMYKRHPYLIAIIIEIATEDLEQEAQKPAVILRPH